MFRRICPVALLTLLWLAIGAVFASATPAFAAEYSLDFDAASFSIESATVGEQTVTYRAYKNLVYVQHPVDTTYQNLNLYVPVEYFAGKSIGAYTAKTAPIFLPNTIGGYMPALPGTPGLDRDGKPNAALTALAHGYVVAEPGARGRTTQSESGNYTGKAPAAIVDLKAAVRYLRHNAARIPGDSEKIISNGTSAGGALSALLGATGNSGDYTKELTQLGAANERDDIFAASCYCPITDLEHADMAYEWLFNGINDYKKMTFSGGAMPSPGQQPIMLPPPTDLPKPLEISGQMTAEQIQLSNELKPLFPAYLNGLQLTDSGKPLKLDADGNGSFKEYVKAFVMASAQTALNQGSDLSDFAWLTVQNGRVTALDFDAYLRYAGRMKTTPAFDDVALGSGENSLFGTASVNAQHFSEFAAKRSTVGGTLAEPSLIRQMNPLSYIGQSTASTAHYWRIRHGSLDRDTSLAVPVILATKLRNHGASVDFALPWGKSHSGDYDLPELFAWVDQICQTK
ncbi:subtype B tannase [Azotosporobacter soli]|uniref:subtype B tannase n=1 Tax=Azotosporobacter soli TaxID=3055040 RepID=UPI0031FF1F12